MKKPLIAVTLGDPAGIGPEIVVRTVADQEVFDVADCIVVGDAGAAEQAVRAVGADLKINCVEDPSDGDYSEGVLNLIDLNNIDMAEFEYGKVSAMCGRAAYEYIEKGIQLTMDGKADAISTAPINKEALRAAGVDFIGHTEIFAALTNTNDPLTMFETNGMRIFFLTF
jgi:4-hydroxythreonine-4-phosphate dehydrogenase